MPFVKAIDFNVFRVSVWLSLHSYNISIKNQFSTLNSFALPSPYRINNSFIYSFSFSRIFESQRLMEMNSITIFIVDNHSKSFSVCIRKAESNTWVATIWPSFRFVVHFAIIQKILFHTKDSSFVFFFRLLIKSCHN